MECIQRSRRTLRAKEDVTRCHVCEEDDNPWIDIACLVAVGGCCKRNAGHDGESELKTPMALISTHPDLHWPGYGIDIARAQTLSDPYLDEKFHMSSDATAHA